MKTAFRHDTTFALLREKGLLEEFQHAGFHFLGVSALGEHQIRVLAYGIELPPVAGDAPARDVEHDDGVLFHPPFLHALHERSQRHGGRRLDVHALETREQFLGFGGLLYAVIGVVGGLGMLAFSIRVLKNREGEAEKRAAMGMFGFSILYLFALFSALLAEQSFGLFRPLV